MSKEFRSAPLTESALKPDVLRITITPFIRDLPTDAIGGSTRQEAADRPLTLHWRELSTQADIPTKKDDRSTFRGFLRHRGELTRRMFEDSKAEPGDVVVFEQLGSHEFRLHIEKSDGTRVSGNMPVTGERERIRKWALRETRPDQQAFRRKVAERDGLECAITGCSIPEILDAAHLDPRAPGGSDDPANGIILRADIHRLFDAGLLSIDAAGIVSISTVVTDPEYRRLQHAAASTGADLANLAARAFATTGA
ncbi:HNH endonuclease [Salipiger bermudensis]|uniref:HNH endonuclease n=1 Tax=Salipiger bermudensis TaxID=344736 RepID=UPI001A8D239A|nr:HNH endonuclease signature motif containing protein [Salipiger bermudensis]MBN9674121.1 HNH endonuclease [Salipiger bermudensis]